MMTNTAMKKVLNKSYGEYLFPRYVIDGKCKADHAFATLNKWLKKHFNGLTAYCLRHTFSDRLKAVECPMDMIDQIKWWKSVSSVGSDYGKLRLGTGEKHV
jgi:integrase